ncbi:MAG: N-acetylmuramoyl-L-alanine amidase [Longibaculum sp.]
MKINVHAGHNKIVQGASSLLNEVSENRIVKNEVISLLKKQGHTVYDCTDAIATTQNANLKRIVSKCNAHKVDLDVSIHLNSGRNDKKGDGKTGGVEVICYNAGTEAIAERICKKISKDLGVRNRGVIYNKNLYVLKNTKAPALLIECVFVDDKDDYEQWNAKQCAKAIVEAILNKSITEVPKSSYLIKVANVKKGDVLNIREKPDANSKKVGSLKYDDPNKYTIVDVKDGWGLLKSGQSNRNKWINLYYTKKV